WRFLPDGRARRAADEDALVAQLALEVGAAELALGLRAAQHASRAVARRAEGLARSLGAGEDEGIAAHVAGDDHGLADVAIGAREQRMALGERARRAFSMDEQALLRAVDPDRVLFELRDVVADVVDGLERGAEHAREDVARVVRHHLPV